VGEAVALADARKSRGGKDSVVSTSGLAVFVVVAFLLPVPILSWLDRSRRGR